MKKAIFALVILAGMAVQSSAQEKKFWVGGSLGFSQSEDNSSSVSGEGNSFSIQPELGYAFSDRWAAGIRITVGQSKSDQRSAYSTGSVSANSLGFAPFARYTVLNWKAFRVFIDGGLSYIRNETDQTSRSWSDDQGGGMVEYFNNENTDRYGIFIDPGFSLRLTPRIALTGRLNLFNADYQKSDDDRKDIPSGFRQSKIESYSANLNSPFSLENFTVGFNFLF